jgi:molybdopterin-containing oxidoreductase family membrane subunit
MRAVVTVLILLSLVGVASLAELAAAGAEPRWRWGYVAGTLAFVLSAGQAAPILALASRLGRGFWGAPLRRVADVLAVTGLVSAPVLVLLLVQLPSWRSRPSIWSDWPGAPAWWDSAAAVGLAIAGLALVWLVTWPDRRGWTWAGTPRQWRVLTRGIITLGVLYTMLLVFVHLLVSSDLALSLVPGWHSGVIPAYHVVSGFEAAIALVLLALAMVPRTAAGASIGADVFHAAAKILLALALLWFYLVWCELLTDWYGRTPDEQSVLQLFMFGPGAWLFLVAVVGQFLVPVAVCIWSPARRSIRAVSIVSAVIVIGNFADRLRLYVAAWTVATPTPADHLPDVLPPLPMPGLLELGACLGVLALAALVVVLVLQRVPAVSVWEVKAIQRLTPEWRLLRTRVNVVARAS